MKVTLVNTYESRGGAAIATRRIFECLRRNDVDTKLLVSYKSSGDPDVITPFSKWQMPFQVVKKYVDLLPSFIRIRKKIPFYRANISGDLGRYVTGIETDLLILNWITGGFFRLESLTGITKPMIWYLHGLWPFTGGCHYTVDCERFMESCGFCPLLKSGKENDLSRKIFLRKRQVYEQLPSLKLIVASHWMKEMAEKSTLLGNREIFRIPIPLDAKVFGNIEKMDARAALKLNPGKIYFSFGAVDASLNKMKGFHLLIEALNMIQDMDFELLVFGATSPPAGSTPDFPVTYFGNVKDTGTLVNIYSSSDIFIQPSMFESFGMTAQEAMACNTPVVGFGIGGVQDIVDHEINGYLAPPFEVNGLAEGIRWILKNPETHYNLSLKAREKVLREYDYPVIAEKLKELFQNVMNR